MKNELLEIIDETVENICKWANKEFKEKKLTSRDVIQQLEESDKSKNDKFEKQLRIIEHLSELLQARANIENNITNE